MKDPHTEAHPTCHAPLRRWVPSKQNASNHPEEISMPAHNPEDICRLFQQHMAAGDIDAVLTLYDRDVAFLSQAGEVIRGRDRLKQELSSLVTTKPRFEYSVKQIVHADDIALMHTHWTVSGPQQMKAYAIEVARRQPDGTWRWLIGDPFLPSREKIHDLRPMKRSLRWRISSDGVRNQ